MKGTRLVTAALAAAACFLFAAPDADAHGKRNKHWKREYKHRRHVRPDYQLVWKWTWDNHAREWRWIAVYEPIYDTQDYRPPRHDHPFPEDDDHHGHDHDDGGTCHW